MSYPLLLAFQVLGTDSQTLSDMLLLCLIGVAVVFATLGLIGGFMYLLKWFSERPRAAAAPVAVAAAAPAVPVLDARTLALVTAAAYAVVGRPVRVRRISFVQEKSASAWKDAGRANVHSSHKLGRSL